MERVLHRKILFYAGIAGVISIAGFLMTSFLQIEESSVFILTLIFSVISVIASFAMHFSEKRGVRTSAKISAFIFPVFMGVILAIPSATAVYNTLLVLTIILYLLFTIHLFLYSGSESPTIIAVLLILIVIGIFMRKFHLPYSGLLLAFTLGMTSIGSAFFGIRCLYIGSQNIYFTRLTVFGNFVIAFALLGQLFKMQHWPGWPVIMPLSFGLIIIGTLYVLSTLQASGFLDWSPLYRRVFRRIVIAWTFVFLLYAARYMIPELNRLLFINDTTRSANISPYGFGMKDYAIDYKTPDSVISKK